MVCEFYDPVFQKLILSKLSKVNIANSKEIFNYGIAVLNTLRKEIIKNITYIDNLISFACQIIRLINNFNKDLMDKYIINLLNIKYSKELENCISTYTINISTALVIIKYRQKLISLEDVLEFIHIHKNIIKASSKLKTNDKRIIKKDLLTSLRNIYFEAKNQIKEKNAIIINTEFKNYTNCIQNTIQDYYMHGNTILTISEVEIIRLKNNVWNALHVYDETVLIKLICYEFVINYSNPRLIPIVIINKILNLFYNGLQFLKTGNIFEGVSCFNEIYKKGYLRILLSDLLSLCYFYDLKYLESQYFAIELMKCGGFKEGIFILCFLKQLIKEISIYSPLLLCIDYITSATIKFPLWNHLNYTANTPKDVFQKYTGMDFSFVKQHIFQKHTVLHFYIYNNKIYMINYFTLETILIHDNFSYLLMVFEELLIENKNNMDKNIWANKCHTLNEKIAKLMASIKICNLTALRLFIICEGSTCKLPLETIIYDYNESVLEIYRLIDIKTLVGMKVLYLSTEDLKQTYYLINPEGTLQAMEDNIYTLLNKVGINHGTIGRGLLKDDNNYMNRHVCFMYFGHGTGKKYYQIHKDTTLKWIFLFGCSSVKMTTYFPIDMHNISSIQTIVNSIQLSSIISFKNNGYISMIIKNKIIVGCLWDITNTDLNYFTMKFLENLKTNKVSQYNFKYFKSKCKLKWLNMSAIVIYIG